MAIHEFKCTSCSKIHDEYVSGGASGKKTVCPECGGMAEWHPAWGGRFRFTFKDGYDVCTGVNHPTKKHYEEHLRANNLVKVE
jgi:hypothetical protein